MKDSIGDEKFPVWLIADSEPERWQKVLESPLDSRHPARHSIWTSVLDYMQEEFYKREKLRFDSTKLYIRNAIKRAEDKPDAKSINWSLYLQSEIEAFRERLTQHKPLVVLTFGAFAFEFLRRVCKREPIYAFTHWNTEQLGKEFRKALNSYDPIQTNVVPLLHVSISRGKFLQAHQGFVGIIKEEPVNYFEYVGKQLANLFLEKMKSKPIWMS